MTRITMAATMTTIAAINPPTRPSTNNKNKQQTTRIYHSENIEK
jgi:hypothetical protein